MCCKGPPTGISVTRWANGAALHPLTKPHRTKTSSFRLMTPFHLLRPRQHHRLAAVFHLKARRSLRRSVRAHGPFPKSPDHTSQRGLQPAESHRNQRHGSRPVTATRASQNRGSDRFYRWLQQLRRAWGFFFLEHLLPGSTARAVLLAGSAIPPPGAGLLKTPRGLRPLRGEQGCRALTHVFYQTGTKRSVSTSPPGRFTHKHPPPPALRRRVPRTSPVPAAGPGPRHRRRPSQPGQRRAGAAPRYRPADPPPHPAPAATVARLSPGEGGGRPARPRLRAGAAAAPWRERSRRRHSEAATAKPPPSPSRPRRRLPGGRGGRRRHIRDGSGAAMATAFK